MAPSICSTTRLCRPGIRIGLYAGDSVEIFLAADHLDEPDDYATLVAAPRLTPQSAFAQIDIGPARVRSLADHVQDHRTDPAFKAALLASGFAVATSVANGHWRAEVRIPLDAFEARIASRLKNEGARLALGLAFIDYDDAERLPNPTSVDDSYGFKPDNVFSTALTEDEVNVPARMRRAYLAR